MNKTSIASLRLTAIAALAIFLPASASAVTLTVLRSEVYSNNNAADGNTICSGSNLPVEFNCSSNNGLARNTGGGLCSAAPSESNTPFCGNISNEPHIEFESLIQNPNTCALAGAVLPLTDAGQRTFNTAITGTIARNFCNDSVFLCTAIGYVNELTNNVGLDEIQFEVFKFQDGSNPLDPGSTPPLRTLFIDNPGSISPSSSGQLPGAGTKCVLFDGYTNIQGEMGKTNGQYGFRTTVKTQIQSGSAGNITITAVRAYPAGTTRDANTLGGAGNFVGQKPITVDVVDMHLVRASATVVGNITGVVTEPYNLSYRLSKDANVTMTIAQVNGNGTQTPIRTVIAGQPRIGEGVPSGTLINGDSWNGRWSNGDFGLPGTYLAITSATVNDQYGTDTSIPVTRQIEVDPLIITDIRIQPLSSGSTSLAALTYILTQPATVYIDIYPTNTQFCGVFAGETNPLNDVNDSRLDNPNASSSSGYAKFFGSTQNAAASCAGLVPLTFGGGNAVHPIRSIVDQKGARGSVTSIWDGMDNQGRLVEDGDYIFVIYGSLPSQNGVQFNAFASDKRIWTSQAKSGYIPINRGFVGISQITPASSVVGSSPAVAGLNPFFFRYTLSRDALVSLKVLDSTGTVIRTLVNNELRPGLFLHNESWTDGVRDSGFVASSGTYLIQLTATDPLFPAKISTTTALFPLNLYRITDVNTGILLGGASDFAGITYQLSQTMNVGLNIYPPGTRILNRENFWPPCGSIAPGTCNQIVNGSGASVAPIQTITGLRPGRRTLTESWDGRDGNGLFVPDGTYIFTLAAQSTGSAQAITPNFFASDKIVGNIIVARGAIQFTSFNVKPDVPELFNSSNTITLHPFSIEYGITRQSSVTIQILTATVPPAVIRTVVAGGVKDPGILLTDVWDGRDDKGNFPPSGFYTVRALALDLATQASPLTTGSTAQLTISYDPLRIYDVAIAPLRSDNPTALISYQVSETMKVSLKIFRPGTVFDVAGNPSPPESLSLVKRIVGIKPARVSIQEQWDGTDLRQALVPDGTYRFRILASTDAAAIDTLTGNVLNPGALSLDQPIDDIPVVRSGSATPNEDFINNTFSYPNPATGRSVTIQIYVPLQAKVSMKIFNIAGALVYDWDFGEVAANSCVQDASCRTGVVWNKINKAGKTVGRGMYYAVIREEETIGGRNVLQTIKKILIP